MVSVIGNEAAKVMLAVPQAFDLLVVGHAAPEETRKEMVAWLKTNCPGVPILALNSPVIRELPGAEYNAIMNGPETWLRTIAEALGARS